jgi:hypothetical protein
MSIVRIAIFLYLLGPIALLIISLRWLRQERSASRQLELSGDTCQADIVKAGRESLGRSYRNFVTYRFSTTTDTGEARIFSRTQSISDKHLQNLRERQTVTVSYLPDDPTISRLSDSDTDYARQQNAQALIFLAVTTCCGALVLFALVG